MSAEETKPSKIITSTKYETIYPNVIILKFPAPAVEGNEEGASTSCATETSKSNNLVRIQQRKQQVYNWPRNKKILKLAIYSHCQVIFKFEEAFLIY